jgi:hypothetical protein
MIPTKQGNPPERQGGVSGLLTLEGAPVPLLGVRIEARLNGLVLECTVVQRFLNQEKGPIEAV